MVLRKEPLGDEEVRDGMFELYKIMLRHKDLSVKIAQCLRARKMNRKHLFLLQTVLFKQRKLLLNRLKLMYPIISSHTRCSISSLNIPYDTTLFDNEHVSTALGYVSHTTLMLSKYLQVPLRYELVCSSSRSLVRDGLASCSYGFTFPLFRRETERRRFNRALEFLAADIKQLLWSQGLDYHRNFSFTRNLELVFGCTKGNVGMQGAVYSL